MSKIVIENLLKLNIGRKEMSANGFSVQKYDDVLRGKSSYKLDDIIEISEKFQLSLDYLVFGKDIYSGLSDDKQRLMSMYDLLNDREQGLVMGYLTRISEEHKNSAAEKGA